MQTASHVLTERGLVDLSKKWGPDFGEPEASQVYYIDRHYHLYLKAFFDQYVDCSEYGNWPGNAENVESAE